MKTIIEMVKHFIEIYDSVLKDSFVIVGKTWNPPSPLLIAQYYPSTQHGIQKERN